MSLSTLTTPAAIGVSGSAANGAALALSLGSSASPTGTTWLEALHIAVDGGSSPVNIIIAGLLDTYIDGTTAGQLSWRVGPGTNTDIRIPRPIGGGALLTMTSSATSSGQTVYVTACGFYR